MELGIMLAGGGGLSVPDLVELGRRAETAGFGGVYVPESWRSGFVPIADPVERDNLRASYDALFELAERSAAVVGEEVHDG
jgi:hypothetical protein